MADEGISYEQYSDAMRRLMSNASQEGTPEYVQDANVIKSGDAQHGKQFDADYQNERTGGNIPIDQWRADPSIGPHALMRTVLPVAAMPFDWSVQAADALANLNRKITGGEPVTPTPLPSAMLKNALGVPPAPEQGLQKYAETGGTLLLGAAPAAGTAALNALPAATTAGTVANAAKAGGASLVKNAVVAPATAEAGGYVGEKVGGDTGRFVGSTLGGLLPSTLFAPSASRIAQNKYAAPENVSPDARYIAAAEQRLGLPPRYGRLATPEGQELEQNARGPSLAMANRQERSALASAGQEMYQDRRQLPAATGPAAPYVQAAAQARTANLNAPPYTQAGPTASNAAQDMLYQQMRGQPVDITNTINMGRNIAAREVGPGAGSVLDQHLNALEARATRGPNGELTVPWEVAHGTRSGIGQAYGALPALRGSALGKIYPVISQDLANAVGRRGISPDVFHTVDQITHSEMSAAELKTALDRTLGRSSATGGKNFAETVNDLSQPDSRYEYGRMTGAGTPNDVSQKVADIALTARQSYTPPVQGGLRSAISSATQHGAAPVISTMLANLAHQYGLGPYIASATAAAGALPFAKRMIASEYMQSPGVRNAMLTGQRTPYAQTPSMSDLLAAMNAARLAAPGP